MAEMILKFAFRSELFSESRFPALELDQPLVWVLEVSRAHDIYL